MKHLYYLIFVLFLIHPSKGNSQILEPVKWNFSCEKVSEKEYDLVFKAQIDNGWHLYSQDIPNDGPFPTTFTIPLNKFYKLEGNVQESTAHEEKDPTFGMVLKFFSGKAEFRQRIKLRALRNVKIIGTVEFMCCNNKKCLPPTEVDFQIALVP